MTEARSREIVQAALSSPFAGVPSEHATHVAGEFKMIPEGDNVGEIDVSCSCGKRVRLGLGQIVNAHRPEDFDG